MESVPKLLPPYPPFLGTSSQRLAGIDMGNGTVGEISKNQLKEIITTLPTAEAVTDDLRKANVIAMNGLKVKQAVETALLNPNSVFSLLKGTGHLNLYEKKEGQDFTLVDPNFFLWVMWAGLRAVIDGTMPPEPSDSLVLNGTLTLQGPDYSQKLLVKRNDGSTLLNVNTTNGEVWVDRLKIVGGPSTETTTMENRDFIVENGDGVALLATDMTTGTTYALGMVVAPEGPDPLALAVIDEDLNAVMVVDTQATAVELAATTTVGGSDKLDKFSVVKADGTPVLGVNTTGVGSVYMSDLSINGYASAKKTLIAEGVNDHNKLVVIDNNDNIRFNVNTIENRVSALADVSVRGANSETKFVVEDSLGNPLIKVDSVSGTVYVHNPSFDIESPFKKIVIAAKQVLTETAGYYRFSFDFEGEVDIISVNATLSSSFIPPSYFSPRTFSYSQEDGDKSNLVIWFPEGAASEDLVGQQNNFFYCNYTTLNKGDLRLTAPTTSFSQNLHTSVFEDIELDNEIGLFSTLLTEDYTLWDGCKLRLKPHITWFEFGDVESPGGEVRYSCDVWYTTDALGVEGRNYIIDSHANDRLLIPDPYVDNIPEWEEEIFGNITIPAGNYLFVRFGIWSPYEDPTNGLVQVTVESSPTAYPYMSITQGPGAPFYSKCGFNVFVSYL